MSRNLNWTDNKVFSASQPNAPNAGVMGFSYEKPKQQVSPATYSEPKQQVSPATYSEPKQQVSPATYAEPKAQGTDVAGAQYVDPNANQNVAGAQYTGPNANQGVAGAQYADPKSGAAGGGGYPAAYNTSPQNQTFTQAAPLSMTSQRPTDFFEQGPPVMGPGYIPGYLRSLIGQPVRAEFLIGSNLLTDRTGIVREVGVSYFVLEDLVTRSRVMCDLYSVKFVTSL